MSETEDPRTFNKSLAMLQIVDTILYLISAMIIYRYIGPGVESPAILSLSPVMKKIAWGLAIPTVSVINTPIFHIIANANSNFLQTILSGVVLGHVACKYIYVRLFRGSDKMHSRSFLSIGTWVAICLGVWVIPWVVAESIPVFNDLLSLIVSIYTRRSLDKMQANTAVSLRARSLKVGSAVCLIFSFAPLLK